MKTYLRSIAVLLAPINCSDDYSVRRYEQENNLENRFMTEQPFCSFGYQFLAFGNDWDMKSYQLLIVVSMVPGNWPGDYSVTSYERRSNLAI